MKTFYKLQKNILGVKIFLLSFLLFIFSNKAIAQVTATEDFENETAAHLAINPPFSEGSPTINFTTGGAFQLHASGTFGYLNSLKFLFLQQPSMAATTTGTINLNTALNSGIGYKINSFAAYVASDPGANNPFNGFVTISGTPIDGSPAVSATINIASAGAIPSGQTRDANGTVFAITFAGTPLDGKFFTSLTFSINDADGPGAGLGTRYFEIDHISFTTSVANNNTYAIGPVSIAEGNAGTSNLSYQITRSLGTAVGSVKIQSSNGSATSGSDYVALPLTTVNFPIGSTSQTVNVTVNGDVTIELNETINMTLSDPTGGTIATGSGVITITDDDENVEIFDDEVHNSTTFSQNGNTFQATGKLDVNVGGNFGAGGSTGYSASKEPFETGNQGGFTITSPGKSFYVTSVALWSAVVSGTGPNWTFTPTNCTVTITGTKFDGSGTVTHSAAITPTGTNGHFVVNFAGTPLANINLSSISFSVPSPITYLQIDNFKYGTTGSNAVQVSINDVSVLEGTVGSANSATFTITRTTNNTGFSVDLTSSNGSATAGTDYTAFPTTTLNFTNGGALSQTVTVPILKDASIEANETFNMTLSNATNGTLYLKQVGIGTILDDDKICETFTNEVLNATAFSEYGINFSATNRYKITTNGGSTFASPGYLIASGSEVGSMGKMVLQSPGKAFKLISLDVWTSSNGTTNTNGSVTFIGTLFGGGTVSITKAIESNNGNGWQQNVLFTGTPLDNVLLTEIEVVSITPITVVDIDNFCYAIFNTVPIIEVADAGNVTITNGGAASTSNNTDFGFTCVTGGTISKTFIIKNTGAVNLVLPAAPNIILGGADASHFNVTSHSGTTITAGGVSSFSVVFNPTSVGVKNATLSISSNDASNIPFVINIRGEGRNAPSPSPVTTNNALHFDGSDDFVRAESCSNTPIINGGSALTVEYWFKGTDIQSAVRTQDSNDNYMVAGWSFPSKHILSNDLGTGGGVAVGAAATDGQWHHVAFTWQQNTVNGFKSYLDGELVAQRNSGNNPLPVINNPLYLGAFQGSSEFTNGSLDNVRIWNVARTQAELKAGICNFPAPQASLLVNYTFDHGVANANNAGIDKMANNANLNNYTGVLNNFTLNGNSSNWVNGVIPNSFSSAPLSILQDVNSNPNFITANCETMGKVEPGGASPVSGNVTFKSWVESDPSFGLVRRHLEINPINNPATATANITLYFTQADFDFYNANLGTSDPKLPQNPNDTQGLSQLRVYKISGVSNPSDGRPNSYDGAPVDISSSIISKTWNGQFWEIKFSTVGFSGFFVNAGTSAPLPVNLISFSGKSTESGNLLNWKTTNEKDFSHFEVEKSPEASVALTPGGGISSGKFEKIGNQNQNESKNYKFLDSTPPSGAGGLYRLKMVDLDGSFNYSKIIYIENKTNEDIVGNFYPNPAVNQTFIEITTLENGNWNISIYNLTGKLINSESRFLQKGLNKVSIEKLMQGVNFVRFENGGVSEIRKVIKD